jgi:hypothetical protein
LVSGSITLTSGNGLLAGIACDATTLCDTITSIKLDGTTDFTQRAHVNQGAVSVALWSLANVPSGSHTATVTFASANTYEVLFLTEISGASTGAFFDACAAGGSGTGTAGSAGNIAGASSSFYYGVLVAANSTAITQGSGWTIPTNGNDDPFDGAVEYKANPGSTPQNPDFTWTSSVQYAVAGCSFSVAGAASATKPPCLLLGLSC